MVPQVEGSTTPEIDREAPIPIFEPAAKRSAESAADMSGSTPVPTPPVLSPSAGANLIQNPSLETHGRGELPAGWHKGGYGSNLRTFTYPASPAEDGSVAAAVTMAGRKTGDAKWYFDDVPVSAGSMYRFSDWSRSGVRSVITVRFTLDSGSLIYQDVSLVPASADYQYNSVDILVPEHAVSLTVFHLLAVNGTLLTDDYSLVLLQSSPAQSSNLIENGDFEIGNTDAPQGWGKGGWGDNIRAFSYPVAGPNGSRAAQVTVTSYTSGDAKWYVRPIPVSPGVYAYGDDYLSDATSTLTAQFLHADGTYTYKDLARLPPSRAFTHASALLTVPADATGVSVFHLISSVGMLTIDNATLLPADPPKGIFKTGAVTLRFDDGWASQFENALPVMDMYGFKGTFYIVSRQTLDAGFSGFMSQDQVRTVYRDGQEIGAHTRTHPDLATLSASQQQAEIAGSRDDLLSWNVGPVTSFAYPYGSYTATTVGLVRDAGFSSGAASIYGDVTPSSDQFQLERFGVDTGVTAAQVEQKIDEAMARHDWLILTFHRIDDSASDGYTTPPAEFAEIAAYLARTHTPVVTIAEGTRDLAGSP